MACPRTRPLASWRSQNYLSRVPFLFIVFGVSRFSGFGGRKTLLCSGIPSCRHSQSTSLSLKRHPRHRRQHLHRHKKNLSGCSPLQTIITFHLLSADTHCETHSPVTHSFTSDSFSYSPLLCSVPFHAAATQFRALRDSRRDFAH